MNRLSEGPVIVGDILSDSAKLYKFQKIRIGSGGVAVGTSATVVTGPIATLSAQELVADVFLNVLTPSASQTITVGTTNTTNGFAVALSVGTSGIVMPGYTSATSGANGPLLVTNTYGSLLSTFSSGSTGSGAIGDAGLFVRKFYRSDSNASRVLSFTPSSSALGGTTFAADLYIVTVDLTI